MTSGRFRVPAGHPSLPGHFPGRPIVPGVVLLDETLALILAAHPGRSLAGYPAVKFVSPVGPEQPVDVAWSATAAGVAFRCTTDGNAVLHGSARLTPRSK